jgi:GTPase SAR1 family protein
MIDITNKGSKNMFKILIGNKSDLGDKRQVTEEEGQDFANKNAMEFFETSAKNGEFVPEAFVKLTSQILQMVEKDNIASARQSSFKLEKGEQITTETKKKKCC